MKKNPSFSQWYDGLFITENERRIAQSDFTKFLSPNEKKVWNEDERAILTRPLENVSDDIRHLGAWVGKTQGGPLRPDVVVAGVCQGKSIEEKNNWLKWGPTIETICGLDSASAIARYYGCKLHLWIVSQEYANLAEHETGWVKKELEIGDKCHEILANRYPGATIFNTCNRDHRGLVYAAASETAFSKIYPTGVRKPYGIESPTFWDQLDYSSCLGSFVAPALDNLKVWAVVDHDQLRPASGAIAAFPDRITSVYYWPAPNLEWNRDRLRTSDCFFNHLRKAPRRMHRHSHHFAKVHLLESDDSLAQKEHSVKKPEFIQTANALQEVLSYLQYSSNPDETDKLIRAMHTFRNQIHAILP